jgi:hypothetical protein
MPFPRLTKATVEQSSPLCQFVIEIGAARQIDAEWKQAVVDMGGVTERLQT